MKITIGITTLMLLTVLTGAKSPGTCPVQGSSPKQRIQALDRQKNRTNLPKESDFNPKATLEAMLQPGDDTKRWSVNSAATITGYVRLVKPGGPETVNCMAKGVPNMDTHIELVPQKGDGETSVVVIEVSPRIRAIMKQKGEDWSTDALEKRLKGQVITVQGWLFFDAEHANEAETTHPGGAHNWRGTAWEIHPVTGIQITPSK
jgi:hypothetical protein